MVSREEFDGLVDICVDLQKESGQDQFNFFRVDNESKAYHQFSKRVEATYTEEQFSYLFGAANCRFLAVEWGKQLEPYKDTPDWNHPTVLQLRSTHEDFKAKLDRNYLAFADLNQA